MKYLDANNNPIKSGTYIETFYKKCDRHRNRLVLIAHIRGFDDFCTITPYQKRKPIIRLNKNYSRWLIPAEDYLEDLVTKP